MEPCSLHRKFLEHKEYIFRINVAYRGVFVWNHNKNGVETHVPWREQSRAGQGRAGQGRGRAGAGQGQGRGRAGAAQGRVGQSLKMQTGFFLASSSVSNFLIGSRP